MSRRRSDLVGTLARVGLAAVFGTSGGVKAADPDNTYVAVNAYQVLPKSAVEPVAAVLPWFELALALLLLLGVGTRMVAAISAGLLVTFMAGVAQAWARGLSIDCGCFGGGGDVAPEQTSYGTELLRDAGFLLPAIWLIIRPSSRLSLDGWLSRNDGAGVGGGGGQA